MISSTPWPILSTRSGAELARVVMPIGGIGTGTIGLAGRGALVDWELTNHANKGWAPRIDDHLGPGLMLRTEMVGKPAQGALLEGPLPDHLVDGWQGCAAPFAGLPRFRHCRFHSAYPLAHIELRDPEQPLAVDVLAFNPLIPGDSEASGLPVAMLRVRLHNPGPHAVSATLAVVLPNVIGDDRRVANSAGSHRPRTGTGGRNRFHQGDLLHGLRLDATGVPEGDIAQGEIVLTVPRAVPITWRTAWDRGAWATPLRRFWADLISDGRLVDPTVAEPHDHPIATLAPQVTVAPGDTVEIPLIIAWRFPHRRGWEDWLHDGDFERYPRIGNHYATRFPNAWSAAEYAAQHWTALESGTVAFVRSVVDSDLPRPLAEAALSNLSTLRSQTVFRDETGELFAWEGVRDHSGSCMGSCTHVWNYEHALPFLFPDLARRQRTLEFTYGIGTEGAMAFRLTLPLQPSASIHAAADGQFGTIVRAWREWTHSGDDAWLDRHWPAIRSALAFAWLPGSWDADHDGVVEGCQHNTMDVEYYGPNAQITGWYLAALAASERMARQQRDEAFADRCADLRQRGGAWVDAHLFNNSFYVQDIRGPGSADQLHIATRGWGMGSSDLVNPAFQLGEACLIDQTVGAMMATLYGLEEGLDRAHCRTALRAIFHHNRRQGQWTHSNPMRTFAVGDECSVLMATYPTGVRPTLPFPYADEVMTGFEYTLAIHAILLGLEDEAVQVVTDIRARHDGRRRNPFDEPECGRHYGRALASWGLIPAWTGFRFDGRTRTVTFAHRPGRWPWCAGSAFGTCTITPTGGSLTVLGGIAPRRVIIAGQVHDVDGAGPTWSW